MAQAEMDLDLKRGRNSNANLTNFMALVNSKYEFDQQN
jgi:glutaredoxin-related protein